MNPAEIIDNSKNHLTQFLKHIENGLTLCYAAVNNLNKISNGVGSKNEKCLIKKFIAQFYIRSYFYSPNFSVITRMT